MPYIPQDRRDALIDPSFTTIQTPGELNYVITMTLIQYVEQHGLSYQTINDIMGVLSAAGWEFYRRIALPYENNKIAANGDVYDSIMPLAVPASREEGN